MRALLDSHAFLWAAEGNARLGTEAESALYAPDSELYLSLVSVWELTQKAAAGKLKLPRPATAYLAAQARENRVALLAPTLAHVARLEQLPFHHRDPFDRMLVAQAQVEGLTIISVEAALRLYEVPVIW